MHVVRGDMARPPVRSAGIEALSDGLLRHCAIGSVSYEDQHRDVVDALERQENARSIVKRETWPLAENHRFGYRPIDPDRLGHPDCTPCLTPARCRIRRGSAF